MSIEDLSSTLASESGEYISKFSVYSDFFLTCFGIILELFLTISIVKDTLKKKDTESYAWMWMIFDSCDMMLRYSQYSGNLFSVLGSKGEYEAAGVSYIFPLLSQVFSYIYSSGDIIAISFVLYYKFNKNKKLNVFWYIFIVLICSQIFAIPFYFRAVSEYWWFVNPILVGLAAICAIGGQNIKAIVTKDTYSLSFKYLLGLSLLNIFWFAEDLFQFFVVGEDGLQFVCLADLICLALTILLFFVKFKEIKCTTPYILKHHVRDKVIPLNFFLNHTKKLEEKDVLYVENLKGGITNNDNYLIELQDDTKYQIKIKYRRDKKMISNCYKVNKIINDPNITYFDKETGSYIKKWIPGHELYKWEAGSTRMLRRVAEEIEKFHKLKKTNVKGLLKHDYYESISKQNFSDFDEKILTAYYNLVKRFENQALVFSHNDLNHRNIIVKSRKIAFIDTEWTCLNNKYWDYANYIREENLTKKEIIKFANYASIDLSKLIEMYFINSVYCYNWISDLDFDNSSKLRGLKYRNKCIKSMLRSFEMVKINELNKKLFKEIED